MFTGIIECLGTLKNKEIEGTNIHFEFQSPITSELQVDQSVAHNGICLTVVKIDLEKGTYIVTAIAETLTRTNLGKLEIEHVVNIERCTKVGSRLDGHIVQGHVDQTAKCVKIDDNNGSWDFYFEYNDNENVTVEKGSITINGVSLTVVNSTKNGFSVSIIPYTHENTSFRDIKIGTQVNIEFDIVGKYVQRLFELRK